MSLPPPPPTTAAVSAAATTCTNCNSDDGWILFNVRLRQADMKLCTSCVLKLHPLSFCPTCFSLHPIPSPTSSSGAGKTLTCFKCYSLSHSTCVPPNAPKSPYLCPPCSNPNFKFFDIKKTGPGRVGEEGKKKFLDEKSAKVFLAAARIAVVSMSKAVAYARGDVERKVKDAALARLRAKEAIDHFMAVSARFPGNNKRRETAPAAVEAPNAIPVKVEKNNVNQLKVEY